MHASAWTTVDINDNSQVEIQYKHRTGEVEVWLYKENGDQAHGKMKVKQFIEFADMVMKMEDNYR